MDVGNELVKTAIYMSKSCTNIVLDPNAHTPIKSMNRVCLMYDSYQLAYGNINRILIIKS